MIRLYKILTGLALFVFVCGVGYFIVYPLIPKFIEIKNSISNISPYDIGFRSSIGVLMKITEPRYDKDNLVNTIEFVPDNVQLANLEDKNTVLSIPCIFVEGKVVDGRSQDAMLRGFWHHPLSDVPGKRGNVVIFGHRFDKVPPSPLTFFNLDKVNIGDEIFINQEERKLKYKVVKIYTAEKDDQKIFSKIADYQLTLVTCTPLWTSEKRLVVIAVQEYVGRSI